MVYVHRSDTDNTEGVGSGAAIRLGTMMIEARVSEPAENPTFAGLRTDPYRELALRLGVGLSFPIIGVFVLQAAAEGLPLPLPTMVELVWDIGPDPIRALRIGFEF